MAKEYERRVLSKYLGLDAHQAEVLVNVADYLDAHRRKGDPRAGTPEAIGNRLMHEWKRKEARRGNVSPRAFLMFGGE